jgi:hypothetical protein
LYTRVLPQHRLSCSRAPSLLPQRALDELATHMVMGWSQPVANSRLRTVRPAAQRISGTSSDGEGEGDDLSRRPVPSEASAAGAADPTAAAPPAPALSVLLLVVAPASLRATPQLPGQEGTTSSPSTSMAGPATRTICWMGARHIGQSAGRLRAQRSAHEKHMPP